MKSLFVYLALVFILLSGQQISATPPQVKETHVHVKMTKSADPVSLQISPDGDKIVFAAESKGKYQLWLHTLASGKSHPLPGTEGVAIPFSTCWSPDSRSIAFFNRGLMRLDIDTGLVKNLASSNNLGYPIPEGRGCTWNRNGVILFATAYYERALLRISDRGGAVSVAASPGSFELTYPQFLPDGTHFLYYAQGGGGIFVSQLGTGQATKLLDADTAAVYSRSGHLLFVRGDKLYAQGFDLDRYKLTGDPFIVADHVPTNLSTAAVSASDAGPIVYRTGNGGSLRQFTWYDRKGKKKGMVGGPIPLGVAAPDLSPDSQSVALDGSQDGNMDLWILKLKTGKLTRFTSNPANDFFPIWSADGNTIYFSSGRTGLNELYEKPTDGSRPEKLAMNDGQQRAPRGVSRDGQYLLIALTNTLTIQLNANPRRETPFEPNCVHPQFSPDGKWIAYQSYPTPEVYLEQFPTGRRIQISNNGGGHVRWRADGKELFYIDRDGKLTAVPIKFAENGENVAYAEPVALFKPPITADISASPFAQQYSVSQDGQRFLIAAVPKMKSRVTVIRNWKPKR